MCSQQSGACLVPEKVAEKAVAFPGRGGRVVPWREAAAGPRRSAEHLNTAPSAVMDKGRPPGSRALSRSLPASLSLYTTEKVILVFWRACASLSKRYYEAPSRNDMSCFWAEARTSAGWQEALEETALTPNSSNVILPGEDAFTCIQDHAYEISLKTKGETVARDCQISATEQSVRSHCSVEETEDAFLIPVRMCQQRRLADKRQGLGGDVFRSRTWAVLRWSFSMSGSQDKSALSDPATFSTTGQRSPVDLVAAAIQWEGVGKTDFSEAAGLNKQD
ncbi:uncharacterized protein LOC112963913 isoform X2 [Apteryx rowi]|uniref:uncharacterized protein LOC112963913 isoform X2 n=1 Tax=Apteryx rowi TaxID=308060 RepID=UPI000E1D47AE|nr:uncharacterized protein LOC112963913 isoform X2 [Apteryx rowi]